MARQMPRGSWNAIRVFAYFVPGLLFSLAATAADTLTVAEYCKQRHANDQVAQLLCVRETMNTQRSAPAEPLFLVAPLTSLQVIFGFYDRRFPGFNNGKEHLGVDFAAAAGTTAYSVCDGVVMSNNTDYADIVSAVVIVEHECDQPLGKVYGYYGHVHSTLLQNEAVTAGGVIGTVRDWTWNSHLHFGMSTQWLGENWGVVPRGPALAALEEQGWLNPMSYFASAGARAASTRSKPMQSKPAFVRRPAARGVRSKANAPIAKGSSKAKKRK